MTAIHDEEDLLALDELVRSIVSRSADAVLDLQQVAVPFDPALWQTMSESGLTLISTPDSDGGSGAGLPEAATVLRTAAEHASPLPLAECDLQAAWLLSSAGLPVPTMAMSSGRCAVEIERSSSGTHIVSGVCDAVPWARDVGSVVVLGRGAQGSVVFVLPMEQAEVTPGHNLAHEPRDRVSFNIEVDDAALVEVDDDLNAEWLLRGALARSVQTLGVIEKALALSVAHVAERTQFGRPLAKFQAVQILVANAAGEVAATSVACKAAVERASVQGFRSPGTELAIAVAKSQSVRAANLVSKNCHQVHGAIGFTLDHRLRHFTLRAHAWQHEFGNARFWDRKVGEFALAQNALDPWNIITSGIDA